MPSFTKLALATAALLGNAAGIRIGLEGVPQTCTSNIRRMSSAHNRGDFAKHINSGTPYTDPEFTPDESSLFWRKHLWSAKMAKTYLKKVNGWSRPSKLVKSPSLWGNKGVKPAGTNQGLLGDCWFLASASAIAETPARIHKIFTNKNYPKSGIFEVTFYHMGMPFKEVVDDRIPTHEGKDKRYTNFGIKRPVNSKPSKNGAWW